MLTINRTAVTPFMFTGHISRQPSHFAIWAEICERAMEMEEIKRNSASDMFTKMARIADKSPRMFRMVCQLGHGDTSALKSFQEQAIRRGVTKQNVHIELNNELDKIRAILPEAVAQIEAMRASALAHEDPTSNTDAIRASMDE